MYKIDFENERSDRERMADEIEKKKSATGNGKSNAVLAVSYKNEDKQKQLDSLKKRYDVAVRKTCDLEKEVSDLKEQIQTFISKEEASKRSLEEAIAASSKLNEDIMVLTQQVKQYKKQADNLRSQVEKYEQMNKSRVEQVLLHICGQIFITVWVLTCMYCTAGEVQMNLCMYCGMPHPHNTFTHVWLTYFLNEHTCV